MTEESVPVTAEVAAPPAVSVFRQELSELLNRYSRENSPTTDWLLASFLRLCIRLFDAIATTTIRVVRFRLRGV